MADLTEEPLTNPVPQATGGSLPGLAADAATNWLNGGVSGVEAPMPNIPAPPSAQQALLQSNYGDEGAQQYQALQRAGQVAPTSTAADTAGSVVEGLGNLIGNTLVGGLTGNPQYVQQQDALKLAKEKEARLLAQKDAVDTLDFMGKMKTQNLDPSVRIRLIAQNAQAHGRQLSPAEAEYIDHAANSDSFSHLMERIKAGGPDGQDALSTFTMLYSGDPVKMVTANDQIRGASAKSDALVADAQKKTAEAPFVGVNASNEATRKEALRIKAQHDAGRPYTQAEIMTFTAAGIPLYVDKATGMITAGDIPGQAAAAPGEAPGTTPTPTLATDITKNIDKAKADQKAAAEAATTTAATRTMKEKAPKVLGLVNESERLLNMLEKQPGQVGPFASRYQQIMSGKIGAPNPQWKALKDNLGLLTTLVMNMHVGARGSEQILKKFDEMIGAGYQSPENIHSTLNVLRNYTSIIKGAKPGEEVDVAGLTGSSPGGTTPVVVDLDTLMQEGPASVTSTTTTPASTTTTTTPGIELAPLAPNFAP